MTKMQEIELKVKVHEKIKKLMQDCINDMVNIGIPVQIKKIEGIFLGSLKNALAVCRYDKVDNDCVNFNIIISDKIVKHMNDEVVVANVKNSIYHELLHTCPDCQMGHNDIWLEYAVMCDNKLNTKTRTRLDEKVYLNRAKGEIFTYKCKHCGFEYKTVENIGQFIKCPIDKELIEKSL